jgi:transglycosylase-like protein with SLT domain
LQIYPWPSHPWAIAKRIIERGDLTAGEMIGAWAGEIGQTQFLPSAGSRLILKAMGIVT